ncbi:MAG TPA: hypothetical protein VFR23_24670 [Jiangellaceae bacterium]|nr:hypothetical protein [Jiangellaceae bacterium]
MALLTARNSSGVLNFGTKMPGRMSETFEADSRAAINLALRHMIEIEKSIRVLSIDVERGAGGRARFTVRFFDLLTGQRDLAEV